MQKIFKCPYCNKKYVDNKQALYDHIQKVHPENIPADMPISQLYFNAKYKKTGGHCVVCGKPTKWNETVERYERICSKDCKEKYKQDFRNKMMKKYGKEHLLGDPEQQKKMLANRSISGVYTWSDGKNRFNYTGSYELDFLRFLDLFLKLSPNDIIAPAPQVFKYMDGETERFYIPDFYIASIETLVEIKDGGDNPNRHQNRTGRDALKEVLKDTAMKRQSQFNYVKVLDKDYSTFMNFLIDLKNEKTKELKAQKPIISLSETFAMIENALTSETMFCENENMDVDTPKVSNRSVMHPEVVKDYYLERLLDESDKIHIATDWHLWENKEGVMKKNPNFNNILEDCRRKISKDDTLVFLGDLVDDEFKDTQALHRVLESIDCHKVMVMGNNDLFDAQFYLEAGFDHAVPAFEYRGNVFSHYPIVNEATINFHGHLHGSGYYKIPYQNHADVYNRFGKSIVLEDAIKNYNRGFYKPHPSKLLTEHVNPEEDIDRLNYEAFIERISHNPFLQESICLGEGCLDLTPDSDISGVIERSLVNMSAYQRSHNISHLKLETANLWYNVLLIENYVNNPLRKKYAVMTPLDRSNAFKLQAELVSECGKAIRSIRQSEPTFDFFNYFDTHNDNRDVLKESRAIIESRKTLLDILR